MYYSLLLQGGHSPLSIAAYSNRIEAVKLLLSSGADVDAVDEVIEILMIIVYVSIKTKNFNIVKISHNF